MGNLEKYGVLALIFVIVLILTVAIWNGPSTDKVVAKAPEAKPQSEAPPAAPAGPERIAQPGAPAIGANPIAQPPSGPVEANPEFRRYTVEKNDNFVTIAKKTLGAGSKWTEIAKANEGVDPKRLKIGQVILVPLGAEAIDAAKSEPKAAGARPKPNKLASR